MFRHLVPVLLITFTSVAPAAFAQQSSTPANGEEDLQRVEGKIDTLLRQSTEEKAALVDQPLGERQHGVEFNFFRLLLWNNGENSLSGGYSYFDTKNNVEIAIPVMYSSGEQDDFYYYNQAPRASHDLRSFTADLHYRKYLGHRLDGFYLSGFSRLAHLDGALEVEYGSEQYETASETKLGIGVGIGYRIVSTSGLYWGMSLSVGRYLVGDSDIFAGSDSLSADIDDSEVIVDVEFLKFGYAF